jgi:hypothetical protein
MYEFYHPDEPYDPKLVYKNTCKNALCFQKEHLIRVIRKGRWDKEKFERKLIEKCIRSPPADDFEIGCLVWQGYKYNDDKYGLISINGQRYPVHQLSLILKEDLREPPKDNDGQNLLSRHKCKTKLCVEKSHLEWGTAQENANDRERDGTVQRGEKSNSKLTEELVKKIRTSYLPMTDPNYKNKRTRSAELGVSFATVVRIDAGDSWDHLIEDVEFKDKVSKRKQLKKERLLESKKQFREKGIDPNEYDALTKRILSHCKEADSKPNDVAGIPCLLWTGAQRNKSGYGAIAYKGSDCQTHILMCEMKMGYKKPKGLVTRHLCNIRSCCRPEHLEFSTNSVNQIDSVLIGRKNIKLTIVDVKNIRKIPINQIDYKALAEKYKVKPNAIKNIINKKSWNFIKDDEDNIDINSIKQVDSEDVVDSADNEENECTSTTSSTTSTRSSTTSTTTSSTTTSSIKPMLSLTFIK